MKNSLLNINALLLSTLSETDGSACLRTLFSIFLFKLESIYHGNDTAFMKHIKGDKNWGRTEN